MNKRRGIIALTVAVISVSALFGYFQWSKQQAYANIAKSYSTIDLPENLVLDSQGKSVRKEGFKSTYLVSYVYKYAEQPGFEERNDTLKQSLKQAGFRVDSTRKADVQYDAFGNDLKVRVINDSAFAYSSKHRLLIIAEQK